MLQIRENSVSSQILVLNFKKYIYILKVFYVKVYIALENIQIPNTRSYFIFNNFIENILQIRFYN